MTDFEPMAERSEKRVLEAIEDMKAGRFVILTDDEDRENEGDLVLAAEKVTPEAINFMARYGRGLICLALTEHRAEELHLTPMVSQNTSRFETAFTVSIEAKSGVTTGISAADRAHTVRVAIDPNTRPEHLARPGHIFPLRARDGGVLVRTGQTEGSVDLARLAGLTPAAVICEIMNDDGTMARLPDLLAFGRRHKIRICTVADLIRFRLRNESLVHRVGEARVETGRGPCTAILFGSDVSPAYHLAIQIGEPSPDQPVTVRVHRASVLEDVFGCFQGANTVSLSRVLDMMWDQDGPGVVLYLYAAGQDPRELRNHFEVFRYQVERGCPFSEARASVGWRHDPKDFGIGAQILANLGLHRIKLVTNAPYRLRGIEGHGLVVDDFVTMAPTTEQEETEG